VRTCLCVLHSGSTDGWQWRVAAVAFMNSRTHEVKESGQEARKTPMAHEEQVVGVVVSESEVVAIDSCATLLQQ
jgi:hypothetical protein